LYVVDPAAAGQVRGKNFFEIPKPNGAQRATQKRVAIAAAHVDCILRNVNPYVHDYRTAHEIYETDGAAGATLFIDPKRAPPSAGARTYNDFESFHEVSVICPEAGDEDGTVPPRAVVISRKPAPNSKGVTYTCLDIPEDHRAYDPLHFVMLFPRGDPGWSKGLHPRPVGGGFDRRGNRYRSWDPLNGQWLDHQGHPGPPDGQPVVLDETAGSEVSTLNYYGYRLHRRQPTLESLFMAGRLFQGTPDPSTRDPGRRHRPAATHRPVVAHHAPTHVADTETPDRMAAE
jgi:hypothetical protein